MMQQATGGTQSSGLGTQHSALAALTAGALVGTERAGRVEVDVPGALGNLLRHIPVDEAETWLLGAAGACAVYERAGWVPPTDGTPGPETSPAEHLPRCNAWAAQHLAYLLVGRYSELWAEWLGAAARAGKRVPEEWLPDVLNLGRRKPELRAALMAVLGERGRWLARQNPDWDYVAPPGDPDTLWAVGVRGMRRALFARLRAEEPDRARELLLTTWDEEPAEERAALVPLFATGLSMSDEPFLEEALDDRRKEVRQAAADLLARLPESRLVGRMIARVEALLAFTPVQAGGLLKKARPARISVTLPEACDKEMERDGVAPKAKLWGLGERTNWLAQMLELIPPATWTARWGVAPDVLIEATRHDKEWRDLLLRAWVEATARHQDATWADALLTAPATLAKRVDLQAVLLALAPARREAHILAALRDNKGEFTAEAFNLLESCPPPWSAELARAVLQASRRRVAASGGKRDWLLHGQLDAFARAMPPELVGEAAQGWPRETAEWPAWKDGLDEFIAILQFRHEMLDALNED